MQKNILTHICSEKDINDRWTKNNRIVFDIDEYLNVFDFKSDNYSEVKVVVFPNADTNNSDWKLIPMSHHEGILRLNKNIHSKINDDKYLPDYLSLYGCQRPKGGKFSNVELIGVKFYLLEYGPSIVEDFDSYLKELLTNVC